ncbi:MAG: alpha/beta hydrolase family protein [Acidobacteriota bacterium]
MSRIMMVSLCTLGLLACGAEEVPSAPDRSSTLDLGTTSDRGSTAREAAPPLPDRAALEAKPVPSKEGGVAPGAPLHAKTGACTITITATGDAADAYFPEAAGPFPVALLLQGAKVDKLHYSDFARVVASYGFVVVVPNHSTLMGKNMVEERLVVDVLAQAKLENTGSTPLAGRIDAKTLVLLGHSFGGAAGLYAIQSLCQLPFCLGSFTAPPELAGGAFYGTNLKPPFGEIPPVKSGGRPLILVQGSEDKKALPADGLTTYQKIETGPKALLTLKGANHYGLTNANNPSGADADPGAPTLAQPIAVESAARWSALFLRAHVLKDASALAYVQSTGVAGDPNVSLQQE